MIDQIVGQLLQTGTGQDLLRELQEHGLDESNARSAMRATVEGAIQQPDASGVAQFVTTKTGLAPELAQRVVGIALPKVLELIKSASVPAPRPSASGLSPVVERVFSRH